MWACRLNIWLIEWNGRLVAREEEMSHFIFRYLYYILKSIVYINFYFTFFCYLCSTVVILPLDGDPGQHVEDIRCPDVPLAHWQGTRLKDSELTFINYLSVKYTGKCRWCAINFPVVKSFNSGSALFFMEWYLVLFTVTTCTFSLRTNSQ